MPGARWFPGVRAELCRPDRAQRAHRPAGDPARHRGRRRPPSCRGPNCSGAPRHSRSAALPRGHGGRPRRGLPAEHPRGGHRVPGDREHRRDLERMRAGLLGEGRAGPARAARAGRAGDRRGLPVRRQDPRQARRRRGVAGRSADAEGHRAGIRAHRDGRRRAATPHRSISTIRCGFCSRRARRAAQGHHARARRRRARALESRCAAVGYRPRRHVLLVHQSELDDVELPGRRPAGGCDDRLLRRQPATLRSRTRCGTSPPARGHRARHQPRICARLRQGGRRPAQGARPVGAADGRDHRLVAAAVVVVVVARQRRRARPGRVDQRRHRCGVGVHRRCAHRAGVAGGVVGAVSWVSRWTPGTSRATRCAARSASWSSPSRCRRCRSASGTTPTDRVIAVPISRCSPACGAMATGSRSPTTAASSCTAGRTPR